MSCMRVHIFFKYKDRRGVHILFQNIMDRGGGGGGDKKGGIQVCRDRTHYVDNLLPHAPLHYAATGDMLRRKSVYCEQNDV